MEINWYGSSIIIMSIIIVVIFKKIRFIDLFVFFIAFNSTTVITIAGVPVNLPLVLFLLSFFSCCIRSLLNLKINYNKPAKVSLGLLFFILVAAIFSELMPFIINGDYMVLDRYNSFVYYAKEEPLFPSTQWITQLGYFIIGILTVFLIVVNYKTKEGVLKFLHYLMFGIIFMIFWGWFEYFCFFTKISYPYQIFDHIGMSRNGLLIGANGFPRMVSVTLEASYFAQILIPTIPFFYWFGQENRKIIFNASFHKKLYLVSVISLLIAQTSTGVLGFLIIMGLLLKNRINRFSKNIRLLLLIFFVVFCIVVLVLGVILILEKSNNFSGIERLKTITYGIKYFVDYPILGLGFGVFPTYDFVVNLLVNLGLLGTIPFLILIRNIYIKFANLIKLNLNNQYLYKAGLESFILILLVSQLSGFIYHSQYFWMYIGIAISIISFSYNKIETTK